MNRPALALLTRSLRVESRSIWTYAARVALVGVILATILIVGLQGAMMGAPGLTFFTFVVNIDAAFITLAAIGFFATCITEEKEDGTLGLLRMTDLSPVAILLGKFGGRLVTALLLLLAQVPFTLLSITLGGVAPAQIWSIYLSLLAFTLFAASLGLLVSVCMSRSRTAVVVSLMVMFFYFIAPGLVWGLRELLVYRQQIPQPGIVEHRLNLAATWLANIDVFVEINHALEMGVTATRLPLGAIVHAGAGLACFLLAWLSFETFNRRDIPAGPERPASLLRRFGGPRRGRAAWTGLPAIVWKDLFFSTGGINGLILKSVLFTGIVGLICAFIRLDNTTITAERLGEPVFAVFIAIAGTELVIMANRIFSEEVQGHTLSTLALLPLPWPRVLYAKIGGSLFALVPALCFITLGILLAPMKAGEALRDGLVTDYSGWVMLAELICAVHLVALLSLFIRWAAVPAAAAIMLVGHIGFGVFVAALEFATTFRGPNNWLEHFAVTVGITLLLSTAALCHVATGYRLTRLARE